ncbi:(2Fe-2S)-binding protein [Terriglobus roseus]|uniref:Isoquinoline 1-oxidoreductase, alpha subunit n=1 Tax=Terriglobus roseus TaxID=392734 RepID=A0A1H4JT81_9BACT|nr:(2Fe-2S)-binding protein [Terriglobus roseus]SEB49534.1 isoquinoline 1-oxidoreductase, alpha subunit [Terriglobus roseus]
MQTIKVNGKMREVKSSQDTPLLYVLKDELSVSSPQFGCGLAQCGACSVLLDGKEIRSCITPVSQAAGKEVTTIEGLPERWAKHKKTSTTPGLLHPVQEAWIEQQVHQCGFCQSGMMIKATELLESKPKPTLDEIKEAFTTSGPSPHLCRCGTYLAIVDAVRHASTLMTKGQA